MTTLFFESTKSCRSWLASDEALKIAESFGAGSTSVGAGLLAMTICAAPPKPQPAG